MSNTRQGVATTGLLVAAVRAEESAREDRLFNDPYAERLAGVEGRQLLAGAVASGQPLEQIIIRTRFWDDALLAANADGVSEVVILAAGLDTRAYRLPWQAGTTVWEVDLPQVIADKDRRLAGERLRCWRVAVGIDLTDDWPNALRSNGLTAPAKTVWLIEGLLQYLDASAVHSLFTRIDALSAPGSVLLYDVVGQALLEAPFMRPTLDFMQKLGAPWTFATDAPAALVEGRGWSATVTDFAEPGTRWHRWDRPAVPLEVAGAPRGYFVEAIKV